MRMVLVDAGEAPEGLEEEDFVPEPAEELLEQTVAPLDVPPLLPEAQGSSSTSQIITNYALYFLSTASNELLGACALALGSAIYLVFGRLGLFLIGLVGGILLHAAWEGFTGSREDEQFKENEMRRRKEVALDVAARVLDWRHNQGSSGDSDKYGSRCVGVLPLPESQQDFPDFRPATRTALSRFVDAIIRDYVQWWYGPILPLERSFPSTCRRALTGFILRFSTHVSRKRPADTFLDFLTNASSVVIVFLNELSGALMAAGSQASTPTEAIELYLRENPESNLANMLNPNQQQKKLESVANDILHNFLEAESYDCEAARVFLREILAGVVLEITIQSCSKPDWINDWILYFLEQGEPELMNAIDVGVGGADTNQHQKGFTQKATNEDREAALESLNHHDLESETENAQLQSKNAVVEGETLGLKDLEKVEATEGFERERGETAWDGPESGPRSAIFECSVPLPEDQSSSDSNGETETVEDSMSAKSPSQHSGARPVTNFTSFDQIVPSYAPTALTSATTTASGIIPANPSLESANVAILDDSGPGENGPLRAKPAAEYILQIEPASSQQPGWMITRRYTDFESLHEVLRRISKVSGIVEFTEQHNALPGWKGQTKATLRGELERYLRDALNSHRLAECEGMKRFLSKDQGFESSIPSTSSNLGFGFASPAAFETMGRGMLDVLSSAPKGAAVGGKTLLGGVTGVLGGVGSKGQRKAPTTDNPSRLHSASSRSNLGLHRNVSLDSVPVFAKDGRSSQESERMSTTSPPPQTSDNKSQVGSSTKVTDENAIAYNGRDLPGSHMPKSSLSLGQEEELHLPPPPSDIPDDYGSLARVSISSSDRSIIQSSTNPILTASQSTSLAETSSSLELTEAGLKESAPLRKSNTAITESETKVTVELAFAVINELYTLSSAWNIRRTLLNAARTYLLRPGNPNLEAIRLLLQDSVIDEYTSDSGLAALIEKVRENALPTDEERKAWPQAASDEVKEIRRGKARRILVERGLPQVLTGIMGAAASSEALGRVFDCLQVERVARGLLFPLLLQAIRAATQ